MTTSSICYRAFDSKLRGYDEGFLSEDFYSSNHSIDNATMNCLEDTNLYANIIWVSSTENFTTIEGRIITIENSTVYFQTNVYEVYQNQRFERVKLLITLELKCPQS